MSALARYNSGNEYSWIEKRPKDVTGRYTIATLKGKREEQTGGVNV